MIAALLAALLAIAAPPARAAGADESSQRVGIDARIELLGVLQYLAAARGEQRLPPELSDLETAFSRFRRHPAVKAYAAARRRLKDKEPYALISLALSQPPELSWSMDASALSGDFIRRAGGQRALEDFLAQERDFAARARFADFMARHKKDYESYENSAREELASLNYVHSVEAYTGVKLNARLNIILSPLYAPSQLNSYIIPYPDPARSAQSPFEVYVLAKPVRWTGRPIFDFAGPVGLWNELLYILVEKASFQFRAEIERRAGAGFAQRAGCPVAQTYACANHLITQALKDRLVQKGSGAEDPLARRLTDFEAHRDRYPTLIDFYPKLIEALEGL